MNCAKCEHELTGGAVICRQCGFNNVLLRLERWRTQRVGNGNGAAAPRANEVNLIPFPVAPASARTKAAPPEAEQADNSAWRATTKEVVALYRKKQGQENQPRDATAPPARTMLKTAPEVSTEEVVAGALKRIHRVPLPETRSVEKSKTPASNFSSTAGAPEKTQLQAEPTAARPVKRVAPPAPTPRTVRPAPVVAAKASLRPAPAAVVEQASQTFFIEKVPLAAEAAAETVKPAPVAPPLIIAAEPVAPLEDDAFFVEVAEDEVEEVEIEEAELAAEETAAAGAPASLWRRVMSGVFDLEIVALAYLPFFGAYVSLGSGVTLTDLPVIGGILALVIFLYHLVTLTLLGRTFGMMVFGLYLAEQAAGPENVRLRLPLSCVMQRAAGGTLSLLFFPLNFLLVQLNGQRRGLADLLSGTITIRR